MTMTEAYEESVYREGYRKGKEETIKELMAWHDKVCEEMAKRHTADRPMLDDGTLVVSVDDATAVTRVLVEDEKKNGSLYYVDRLKGEWKVNILNYESVCSVCGANEANFIYGTEMWYGLGESKFCPNCGADMRGEDNDL